MSDTCPHIMPNMNALKLDSQPWQDENGQDLINSGNETRKHLSNEIRKDVVVIASPLREPSDTRLARFPPLPEGSAHSKRYYFFGWHVTSKWLMNLALDNNFPNVFAYHTSFDGIRYICWKSGYKYVYPAAGLVENGEQFEGQVPGRGRDIVIDIIMVYVNKQAYAHRRPTELQLEKLTQIFGSKPRWFKDGKRAQDFDDYEMWTPIR